VKDRREKFHGQERFFAVLEERVTVDAAFLETLRGTKLASKS